jgi:hypothetical protein
MWRFALLVSSTLLVSSCDACDRDGCDALERRAAEAGSRPRIAGIVAIESDVVENGCQECGFAVAEVKVWSAEQAVEDEAELAELTRGEPVARGASGDDGTYAIDVEAGAYVVCFNASCFNATVEDAGTSTLNVRLINGVSSGFFAPPGAGPLSRQDALFLPPG